jgi:hypothetical protein
MAQERRQKRTGAFYYRQKVPREVAKAQGLLEALGTLPIEQSGLRP